MQDYFGAASGFVRRQNASLWDLVTIRPQAEDAPYSLLGTAVAYRIRFIFKMPSTSTQWPRRVRRWSARAGCLTLGMSASTTPTPAPGRTRRCKRPCLASSAPFVSSWRRFPPGRRLGQQDEETLCRFWVVLAYFDQAFRTGPERLADSPLLRHRCPAVEDLLSIAPREWVEDLAAQSRLFAERAGNRITQAHWLNPTFEGSNDVGGADADLITGSTLIDIKSTVNPKVGRLLLWQLLGYALLDYSNQYGIDGVGVYLSRQGHFLEWPVERLAQEISSREDISWDEAHSDFQHAISATAA